MNQFFTEVKIPNYGWDINHQNKIMLIGSCFAENIGKKLEESKFQVDQNPFGILYNPLSIAKSIRRLINPSPYCKEDLFFQNELWGSFDHHSRFSATSAEEALEKMNSRLETSHEHLKKSDYLVISFGTAWVYRLKGEKSIVSNCHKFPGADFERFRLDLDDIVHEYIDLFHCVLKFNPNLKVLFTVSPIRHWKDGAIENQLSKSTLLLSVERILKKVNIHQHAYFPSYEIIMDELRDYRFYAPDLLHLNQSAINFIWEKFGEKMFSADTKKLINDVLKINKAIGHRPFNSGSEDYKKFLLYNLGEIERIIKIFPFLNFKNEKTIFENLLSGHSIRSGENI